MTRGMDAWGTLEVAGRRVDDRARWHAAVRLATALTLLAVPLALLATAAGVGAPVLVLGVILVGFACSWSQSARLARVAPVHTC
jgi:hypothetical protein